MLQLSTLGRLDLRGDANVAEAIVQPRRLALLIYLAAAARGHYARRDLLISMFWPEHDAEHGRAALRQQLHGLRAALGEGLVLSRGNEEVGLDEALLTCDVWAFVDALASGDLERAAEAYGGPFLSGYYVPDAPGFERWVEDERERLARLYVGALESLATAAAARRDHPAVVEWCTRLLQADPYNTPAVIQQMKALAARGDRPNAVQAGERHEQRLRADLATTPSREFLHLLASLREASGPGVSAGAPTLPGPAGVTERPPSAAPGVPGDPGATGQAAPPVSRRIGRYRLLRVLGEGGMGVVYEAEQIEPVWRRVALKLIRGGQATGSMVARFEAERQALAVMDHPGIAKVLDAGTTDDGSPYFVMEFVAGSPLTTYCDERRLSTQERLELYIELCEAIQHAHQKGVIHRDLKPSNVLVSERDGKASPRVIDFGIAKAQGLRLTEKTLATDYGAVVGTPAYMSPEQAEGTRLDVDTRADIYSLGVLLYELLSGRLPIDPGEVGLVQYIALLALQETSPPTPSERVRTDPGSADVAARRRTEPARLAVALRGDLDWIVMKAIAPERERRYATAAGLSADVVRYLRDEPVQARPPSAWYRARKFAKRNTVGVVAGAAAVLALAGGAIASTMGFVEARRSAATATRASAFLSSLLEFGDPGRTRGGVPTARDILDDGQARVATQLADQPEIQADLYYTMARANYYLGRWAIADSLALRSLALTERYKGRDHPDVVKLLSYLFYFRGQSHREESLVVRALDLSRRLSEPARSAGLASGYIMMSAIRINRRQFAEAEAELTQAIATLEAYPEPTRRRPELGDLSPGERLAHAYNQLASVYGALYRPDEREAIYRRSLALYERTLGPGHPDAAILYTRLAEVTVSRGRLVEAESLARRAVAVRAAAEGATGPTVARYTGDLGNVLFRAGRLAEAESLLSFAATYARTDISYHAQSDLAWVLLARGRVAESERAARLALERSSKRSPQDSLEHVAAFSVTLGTVLVARRRYAEAEAVLLRAAGIFGRADSLDGGYGRALGALAAVMAATGRPAEAERYYLRALAVQEHKHQRAATLVTPRDDLVRTLEAYGAFLRAAGRRADAEGALERADAVRSALPDVPVPRYATAW